MNNQTHNGKKKNSNIIAYVPLNTSYKVEPLIEQKISQIPPYEDRGVKYQGKYKSQQSENTYELKTQTTRFYNIVGKLAAGSNLNARSPNTTRFYCTKIIIQHRKASTFGTLAYIQVSDVKGTTASSRLTYFPTKEEPEMMVLDFSDSPREFLGEQIDIYSSYGMAADEFVSISLYGWEEQP